MDDFLIIGGGIAGVSAGARLAELGRVTLLEAEDALGYHASGRSAALYESQYGLASTVALSQASRPDFEAAGVLSPRGLMFVGGPDEAEVFAADRAKMGLHEVSVAEARAMVPVLNPEHVTHAAWHEEAWDVDTDQLIQHYARALRQNGQIATGARVSAIARTDAGWEVTAGGESFHARVLVNAAGAWADVVAGMAGVRPLGFTPLKRSIARVAAPEDHDPHAWPMVIGAGETWYMKPDAGALLISPADETQSEPHDAWAEDMALAEGIAGWEAHVTTPVARMIANWAGLRTFSPDRNLVIGPATDAPGFLWFAGQGGYGFQTAPGASRMLADLVAGRESEIDPAMRARLDPARFG